MHIKRTTINTTTFVLYFCIYSLLFAHVIISTTAYECKHDLIVNELKRARDLSLRQAVAYQDYNGESMPTPNNTRPIRIHIDTNAMINDPNTCYSVGQTVSPDSRTSYTCKQADIMSSAKMDYLKDHLLPGAATILASALRVLTLHDKLYLVSMNTCGSGPGVRVSTDYVNDGIEADLVLFITNRPITTEGVIAFGSACQQDQFGRPIAGQLNFNPAYLDTSQWQYDSQLGTSLHEISHVLGFDYDKLSYFNVPSGSGRPQRAYAAGSSVATANSATRSVERVNTPKVLEYVRNHFNCPTLEGAELEDGGSSSSTRGSHWEKRLFYNEYMTGSSSRNPVFSGLTLALFEDSGWYSANYDVAEPLVWGAGMGCDFVEKSCAQWPNTDGYYCGQEQSSPSCTFDHQARGICNTVSYQSNDPTKPSTAFQYFSDPLKGGNDYLADYCPFTQGYSNGWCFDQSNSMITDNQLGQVWGSNSYCYMSTVMAQGAISATSSAQGICYITACLSDTHLKVKVGTTWYNCPEGGSADMISGSQFTGSLTCPKTSTICMGAAVDPDWPRIESAAPEKGHPGSTVTIIGSGFTETTQVIIGSVCAVQFVNSTYLIATIADTGAGNIEYLAGKTVSIIVNYTSNGRNDMLRNAFQIWASSITAAAVFDWLKTYYYVPAAGGALILALIIGCCVYCRRRRRAKNLVKNIQKSKNSQKEKDKKKNKQKLQEEDEEAYYDDDEYYEEEYYEEDYEEEDEKQQNKQQSNNKQYTKQQQQQQQHQNQQQVLLQQYYNNNQQQQQPPQQPQHVFHTPQRNRGDSNPLPNQIQHQHNQQQHQQQHIQNQQQQLQFHTPNHNRTRSNSQVPPLQLQYNNYNSYNPNNNNNNRNRASSNGPLPQIYTQQHDYQQHYPQLNLPQPYMQNNPQPYPPPNISPPKHHNNNNNYNNQLQNSGTSTTNNKNPSPNKLPHNTNNNKETSPNKLPHNNNNSTNKLPHTTAWTEDKPKNKK